MATPAECRAALEQLSRNLGRAEGNVRTAASLDRSLSCWITDLDITFTGQLRDGSISGLTEAPGRPAAKAQIGLSMSGDDLVALVGGKLNFASAWASGRVKLDAGIRDLLQLRKLL